jgi:hypothetical protein
VRRIGSVYGGSAHVPCILSRTERHEESRSDTGEDGRVMTQITTQKRACSFLPGASLSSKELVELVTVSPARIGLQMAVGR